MKKLLTTVVSMLLLANINVGAQSFETATDAVKNMGLGWNLGNTLEAHAQSVLDVADNNFWGQQDLNSETCWGQYVTKPELLKMMKDAGFGAIRVPVTWYNHMDKDGNVDAAWMARVTPKQKPLCSSMETFNFSLSTSLNSQLFTALSKSP